MPVGVRLGEVSPLPKGAVKLHLVLDHDGYLPCYGVITEGNVHDVKAG